LAKKQKLATEKLKRDTLTPQGSIDSTTNPIASIDKEISQSQTSIESPSTPWEDSYQKSLLQPELPEWFSESPEDLEVFIAERHFESALELLLKTKEYCAAFTNSNDPFFLEIK